MASHSTRDFCWLNTKCIKYGCGTGKALRQTLRSVLLINQDSLYSIPAIKIAKEHELKITLQTEFAAAALHPPIFCIWHPLKNGWTAKTIPFCPVCTFIKMSNQTDTTSRVRVSRKEQAGALASEWGVHKKHTSERGKGGGVHKKKNKNESSLFSSTHSNGKIPAHSVRSALVPPPPPPWSPLYNSGLPSILV